MTEADARAVAAVLNAHNLHPWDDHQDNPDVFLAPPDCQDVPSWSVVYAMIPETGAAAWYPEASLGGP